MDYESASARELGAWNPRVDLAPFLEKWSVPNPEFVVDEVWRGMVAGLGFSGTVGQDVLSFWDQTVKEVYSGDEGRKKLRVALINLMERDGLAGRIGAARYGIRRRVINPIEWYVRTPDLYRRYCHRLDARHVSTPMYGSTRLPG